MTTIIIITPPPPKRVDAAGAEEIDTAVTSPYGEARLVIESAEAAGWSVRIVDA